MSDSHVLSLWTIYHRPVDVPGAEYVVREFQVHRGGGEPVPTSEILIAPTLEAARELIPPQADYMMRDPNDPPHVVETWL